MRKVREHLEIIGFQLMTPLHAASASGQITVVKNLLTNKTEVDALNVEGNSPLHTACLNGQDVIVSELINAGASLNLQNNKGQVSDLTAL